MKLLKSVNAFYSSRWWAACREAYLDSVGRKCERCAEKGLVVPADEVHHKIRLNTANINDADITVNFSNLEALCSRCHKEEHGAIKRIRYEIGEDGKVLIQ